MSLPATIKALQTQPDFTVKVVEIPFSTQEKVKNLAANEVILKIHAVGINPTDWKHSIANMWGEPYKISGCDAAGEVVKVGSAVTHLKVGDRAFGFLYGAREADNGAYSEYARFNANVVTPMPNGMSYAEAAAFPIPHLTAFMYIYCRLQFPLPSTVTSSSSPKPNFLVWGGATAVGHHAVQLAKLSGYRVITTASTKNHEFLKSIGADVVIDYKDADVSAKLKEAVKEGGLKYAVDCVSEYGSIDIVLDTITEDGAYVVTTLPVSPNYPAHHPNTKVEFALVYAFTMDKPFIFGKAVEIAPIKGETEQSKEWVSSELPKLLAGWEEGKGSSKFVGQKLRVGHGLDKIVEGLVYMKEGRVSGEKLVYII